MFYFLIFFIHSLSWSTTEDLSGIIHQLDDISIDPKCQAMSVSDLELYCAEEICGRYKDDISIITASNYHKRLTKEEVQKVKNLEKEIRDYFSTLQNNAKLIDKKIEAIKNKKASKEELSSPYAEPLAEFYPFKSQVDSLVQERMKYFPDIVASCQAAMVMDLLSRKEPNEKLYQEAFQKIDQAVISKFSLESAQNLRTHLKKNVQLEYEGMDRGSFHVSPFKVNNPLEAETLSAMVNFANKIKSHVSSYSCNSLLGISSQPTLSDSVMHERDGNQIILNMSPYTCTHGVSSPTIVAHEIAHMISHYIGNKKTSSDSKKKFTAHRDCVKTQGDSRPAPKSYRKFSKDYLTTEEDHADAMAFAIKDQQSNLCALLLSDGKEFQILKHEHRAEDTHSPSLLRAMRDFHSKGIKLPDTCRELARRKYPKGALNKCSL